MAPPLASRRTGRLSALQLCYYPVYGYSLFGNCYLVEQHTPDRPYLLRVCPPR
ncbi:MAG: hypothetical protein WA652_11025 [Xanthobacteraceae bacterium]